MHLVEIRLARDRQPDEAQGEKHQRHQHVPAQRIARVLGDVAH